MINDLIKEGIFIIHALKGYEFHEQRIIKIFGNEGLNYEFVTDGDPAFFNKNLLDKYFVENIRTVISEGVMSCTLNHIYAYERIVSRNLGYAIIFENDPFLIGDFRKKLEKLSNEIENLPKGFIISLENTDLTFPSYWDIRKGKHLYRAKTGRMAGAYLIDLAGAKNILKDLESRKCHTVIDFWHNSLIERGVVKMYWAQPPLVEQGSHNGHLHSVISTEPHNLKRRLKWQFHKFYKYYIRRLFGQKCIIPE